MAESESSESATPVPGRDSVRTRGRSEVDLLQASGRFVLVVLAAGLAFYFASKGVSLTRHYYDVIDTAYQADGPPKFPEAGDITVFYTAGRVITSDERSGLYNDEYFIPEVFATQGWQRGDLLAGSGAWSKFYNPPIFALLLSPLSLLDVHTAYMVVLGINIGAGVLLILLLGRILRWQQPASLLLGLGLFAYTPLYFVFQHAQPSLLLAVVLAASFILSESGAYRRSAFLLAFAGIKPQWLVLPALVVAQRHRAALLWSAGAALLIIVLPFLLVGASSAGDYLALVLERGSGDIANQQFSSASLSWSGFLRALTGEPQPVLWVLLAVITLAVFVFVCLNGDSRLSASAAILTTLLVVPHSHPQDWVVVIVAGAIALSRNGPVMSQIVTGLCLVGVFFGANHWPAESYEVSLDRETVYWITPAGAALLAWLFLQPLAEARIVAAPWPSVWRFEWESPALARIRPWHLAGVAFSVGMVLGVSAALALVQRQAVPPAAQQIVLPPPSGPSAEAPSGASRPEARPALVLGESANAAAGWSLSGPNVRNEAELPAGGGIDRAAAIAGAPPEGVTGALTAPDAATGSDSVASAENAGLSEAEASAIAEVRADGAVESMSVHSSGEAIAAGDAAPEAYRPPLEGNDVPAAGLAGALDHSAAAEFAFALLPKVFAAAVPPARLSGSSLRLVMAASVEADQMLFTASARPAGVTASLAAGAVEGASLSVAREAKEHAGAADGFATAESSGLPARALTPPGAAAEGVAVGLVEGPAAARALLLPATVSSIAKAARLGGSLSARPFHAAAEGTGAAASVDESQARLATPTDLSVYVRRAGAFQAGVSVSAGRVVAGSPLAAAFAVLDGVRALAALDQNLAFIRAAVAEQRAALAAAAAAARVPTPVPTPADRTDCDELRATGPRSAGEEALLRACPPPVQAAAPPPPEPPRPPPAATAAPAPAGCTRVIVAARPAVTALPDGGFRLDAEIAASEPAGCREWPAAFSATAAINITSGSAAFQGLWSCESGRSSTAGVSASTHFAFFCTIGQRAGPASGAAGVTIQVTALGDGGAVLSTSSQSFPAPVVP